VTNPKACKHGFLHHDEAEGVPHMNVGLHSQNLLSHSDVFCDEGKPRVVGSKITIHDIQCDYHVATYIILILLSRLYWGSVEGSLSGKYKCIQWFLRHSDILLVW
jgi:hypothetical protein